MYSQMQERHKNISFASLKKYIIPVTLLHIIAVIVGASAANIVSILERNTLFPTPENNLELNVSESSASQAQHESGISDTVKIQPLNTESADTSTPPPLPAIIEQESDSQYNEIESASMNQTNSASSAMAKQENIADIEAKLISKVRQLILPTLDITTPIIDIPIVEGNWDISQLDDDAGVLDGFSKQPDDPGALVIAAHATTTWPTAGPFADLRNMNIGDPIIFKTGNIEYVYTISRFLRVSTSDVDVLNKGGEDGIVLVTCGNYNHFTGVYGSRLIVYGNLTETRETVANASN